MVIHHGMKGLRNAFSLLEVILDNNRSYSSCYFRRRCIVFCKDYLVYQNIVLRLLNRVLANESRSKSSNLLDEELLIGSASYKILGTGILYVEVYLESNGRLNIVVL